MDKLNKVLEKYLVPIGSYLSSNKYLQILRKSMLAIMPLTIAGSVVLIINSFPFIDNVVPDSNYDRVRSLLGIISSVSLSWLPLFSRSCQLLLCIRGKTESIIAMIVGISSFLI